MPEDNTSQGSPATQNRVAENTQSFFATAIKPIVGKLITGGIIVILTILVLHYFLQSFKKDHTLELMQQKIDLLEQQRKDILADRAVLQGQLNASTAIFKALDLKDSLLQVSVSQVNSNINQIKNVYHEKIKAIDHFSSADLQHYYDSLPKSPDNDY